MTEAIADFGSRVRDARENKGWSQERLAQESGISVRTVIYIEQGRGCALDTAYTLARLLGIGLDAVLPESDPPAK